MNQLYKHNDTLAIWLAFFLSFTNPTKNTYLYHVFRYFILHQPLNQPHFKGRRKSVDGRWSRPFIVTSIDWWWYHITHIVPALLHSNSLYSRTVDHNYTTPISSQCAIKSKHLEYSYWNTFPPTYKQARDRTWNKDTV